MRTGLFLLKPTGTVMSCMAGDAVRKLLSPSSLRVELADAQLQTERPCG